MNKQDRIDAYLNFFKEYSHLALPTVDDLDRINFFIAPASTKYHGAYEGGLFDHSLEVATVLVELTEKLGLQWQNPESPKVVGMFHDLCKCDDYMKRPLESDVIDGGYMRNPEIIIPGHGDKSVIMLQQHMPITNEEIACIRWHMGAFETDPEMWKYYGKAVEKFPNVLYTHTADMIAAKIRGV